MKERIIQFLSENQLTSTKFADTIGVQRSSISHILSGRNKPSFDFIEKMLLAYPDLNAQWLITGKGSSLKNQPSLFDQDEPIPASNLSSSELNIQNNVDPNKEKMNSQEENQNTLGQNSHVTDIERVIIFYRNGSFKEYKPD